MRAQPVLIVGAGIAGLTLALALAKRGQASAIYEQAAALSDVGAGLQLSPNATRILDSLGLAVPIGWLGITPDALIIRNGLRGRELVRLPFGERMVARHGASYRVIHRADLQRVLLEAVNREPLISLHLAAQVLSVDEGPDGVRLGVIVGGDAKTTEGCGLIGADGVRSKIRQDVLGGSAAVYSGYVAWRAAVSIEDAPSLLNYDDMRNVGLWLGPKAHFLHYPLRNGRDMNFVAVVEDHWQAEGWSLPGLPSELIGHFAKWSYAARLLLDKPRLWTKWALCGVDPSGPWVRGAVALIGDAAHAMLPFAAQGACSAIEDAAVLARLLADETRPISQALSDYERLRKPRVSQIIETARQNGKIYHMGGSLSAARDASMKLLGGERLAARQDWIYQWVDEQ